MGSTSLTAEEKRLLLRLARQSIEAAALGLPLPRPDLSRLPPALCEPGASFVTITEDGELRGCIGALESYQPLAYDVIEHAAAAAREDYRFAPVRPAEVPCLVIEVSRLTAPESLAYESAEELPQRLRCGVDGVILRDGFYRATFLPQVWEKLPEPAEFLSHLCQKMGAPPGLWRRKILQVSTYQVEEFHEE